MTCKKKENLNVWCAAFRLCVCKILLLPIFNKVGGLFTNISVTGFFFFA